MLRDRPKYWPLIIDLAICLIIMLGIMIFAQKLWIMTTWVVVSIGMRALLYSRFVQIVGPSEWMLFSICVVLGGFNDWNSVDIRKIYHYTVPTLFPAISTIPFWMFLFWGVILRAIANLNVFCSEKELRPSLKKVLFGLSLVIVTRYSIYNRFMEPVWSWVPFLGAWFAYHSVLGLRRNRVILSLVVMFLGTVIESILIRFGKLHFYYLGLLGGVPIWISIWWSLISLIWIDLWQWGRSKIKSDPLLWCFRRAQARI